MKIEYRCCVDYSDENSQKIIELLEQRKIKYEDATKRSFIFCLYSDDEITNEILGYPRIWYTMTSIFSNEEMEKANWYTFEATRHDIETSDPHFTYEYSCPYETKTGVRYHHEKQINPYISKRVPKWKNNYNFCSINTGDFNEIFCSDIAKIMIQNRNIKGIEFIPVINRKNVSTENISQLQFPNILPRDAFDFIGEYKECICPICGEIRYIFDHPMCDNMRIKTEFIPTGIDAFSAEMSVRSGWIKPPVIVSKKIYNLVTKELKEKHVRFFPIG